MSLFDFGKKKEETCSCRSDVKDGGICRIKVLGSGCKNCHTLLENTKEAVKATGKNIEIEYVTDMQKIMGYGVMNMPALVVDEKVVSMGKVLKATEIVSLIYNI